MPRTSSQPPIDLSYHSFGPATNGAYVALLQKVVARHAARCGVDAIVDTTPGSSVGAKQSRSLHPLDVAVLTSRVWRAARAGADVAIVGNIQDPGLYECRGLVDIPVIGLLESVFAITAPFGRSVALICTNRSVEQLLSDRLATYGVSERLHAFGFVDIELVAVSRALAEGNRSVVGGAVARTVELGRQLRDDGADVVAVASGLLDVVVQTLAADADSSGDVTDGLLSPVAAAMAMARAAVDLRRAGVPIGRGGHYSMPDTTQIERYMARIDRLVAMEAEDS